VLNNIFAGWNGGNGVMVDTFGKITAIKINANGNDVTGVRLDNTYGLQPVIFTGDSFIRDNQNNGLAVSSHGNVTISKVTAEGNRQINILAISTGGNITVSKVISRFAGDNGLHLVSDGNIYLTTVVSMSNGDGDTDGDGVYINVAPGGLVTIKLSVFMGNAGNGIEVVNAIPTLYKTYYFGNDVDGDWTPDQVDLYVH